MTYRTGNCVVKIDPVRLGAEWKSKMEQILELWDLPVTFISGGYSTPYIDGTDLHGNKPFYSTEPSRQSVLIDADI